MSIACCCGPLCARYDAKLSHAYLAVALLRLPLCLRSMCEQALNNAQATYAGFGFISSENVFKVCDQPHPLRIKKALDSCAQGDFESANAVEELWANGYRGLDIVGTLFRLAKNAQIPEEMKLEYIKEIGFCHMRVLDGLDSLLQMSGLIAKLCVTAGNFGVRPPPVKK